MRDKLEGFIKINEVFALWLTNDRAEITIEGIFVMTSGIGYFVSSMSDIDEKSRAIMVNFHGLEKRLLSSVPAYGGGKYSYCDKAMVSGVLSTSLRADFPCAIGEIHNFIIYKYGEGVSVNL
ncbi:hypothetical protein ACQUJO_05705 [Ralstonia pseudosolanacearum]